MYVYYIAHFHVIMLYGVFQYVKLTTYTVKPVISDHIMWPFKIDSV